MPKRVPTIAITVIRDGKRVTPEPNKKAFNFTDDEIESVTKQHPAAFRKPVNETSDDQDTATAETAPEKTVKATAAKGPKAKGNQAAKTPKAKATPVVEEEAEEEAEDETETEDESEQDESDDAAGEDDDI